MTTAIVLGGTGLVGSALLDQLLQDARFDAIVSLGRRETGRPAHPKMRERVVDLANPTTFEDAVRGDVLFSTLGTTVKKAGSQAAQYDIDHGHQLRVAKAAAKNGVPAYVLVSALGANARATMFYNRMKGELERDVRELPFQRIRILQPSFLAGDRGERRPLEAIGIAATRVLTALPGLRGYQPNHASDMGRAMIAAWADETPGVHVYVKKDLLALGSRART